jgi:hypothetical protein
MVCLRERFREGYASSGMKQQQTESHGRGKMAPSSQRKGASKSFSSRYVLDDEPLEDEEGEEVVLTTTKPPPPCAPIPPLVTPLAVHRDVSYLPEFLALTASAPLRSAPVVDDIAKIPSLRMPSVSLLWVRPNFDATRFTTDARPPWSAGAALSS